MSHGEGTCRRARGEQATPGDSCEGRRSSPGLVPASELMAAQSSLSLAEKRVADLERELAVAREDASAADGRAKAAVTAAAEERRVSDALVAGLQDDYTSLQSFITDLSHPLIG